MPTTYITLYLLLDIYVWKSEEIFAFFNMLFTDLNFERKRNIKLQCPLFVLCLGHENYKYGMLRFIRLKNHQIPHLIDGITYCGNTFYGLCGKAQILHIPYYYDKQ